MKKKSAELKNIIDRTTITIWVLIMIPLIISMSFVYFDIEEQNSKENFKIEIDILLAQASYYANTNQFEKSINESNKILKKISYNDFPYEYAITQQKIGDSYLNLAELKDNDTNLENSINAYNKALMIFTIDRYPIHYAETQKNIGVAYHNLANLKDNEINLENSTNAYKEALIIYTINYYPFQYADIQNYLGDVYHDLSKIQKNGSDQAYQNNKSIVAYKEALKIYTIDSYPIQYGEIQNKLNNVISTTYTIYAGEHVQIPGMDMSIKVT